MIIRRNTDASSASTLAEVVIAISIIAVVFSGIIQCYTLTTRRAQWSGYSLAAQAVGIQQLEQARAAVWDYSMSKNELTNLNLKGWTYNASTRAGKGYSTTVLDLPMTGTNAIYVTNFVSIRMLYVNGSSNPPVQLQMVRVDTAWPFRTGGKIKYFTNTVANYFAPDNRDATSL